MVTSSRPLATGACVYVWERVCLCVTFQLPFSPRLSSQSSSFVALTANEAEDVWVSEHIKGDRTGICNTLHTLTHTHTLCKCNRPAPCTHLRAYIRCVLSAQRAPRHIGKGTAERQPEAANGCEWESESEGEKTDRMGERKGPGSKKKLREYTKQRQHDWIMQIALPDCHWIRIRGLFNNAFITEGDSAAGVTWESAAKASNQDVSQIK